MNSFHTNKFRGKERVALVALSVTMVTAVFFHNGCELIDPTEVRNPQITDESLIGQAGSTAAAVQSARFGFADLLDNTSYFTDVISDNYDNVATFISPNADDPRAVRPDDLTLNGGALYSIAQGQRAQITFAINEIAPKDPNQSAVGPLVGDLKFYRGMSTLILGENFAYAPLAPGAVPVSSNSLIDNAISDFTSALTTGSATIRQAAQFALARAYRQKGDKANAVTAAGAALATTTPAAGATYVFSSPYDAATQVNTFWTFAVSRNLNDIQPLPRLDFLDPKYTDATGASPIPALKAEEMYLILAEANLSDNDLATAKTNMKNAITLALSTASPRGVINYTDIDPRSNRPNRDTVLVQANSTSPTRAGLVKRRGSGAPTVAVKQTSNTSVTTANVDTLVSGVDHLWMLYLLRQEVLFGEGRRMSDLGIRLPMIQREIDTSPAVAPGDPGTSTTVPAYIPTGSGMDAFATSGATGICTITNDMNLVLANNRVSRFTIPF